MLEEWGQAIQDAISERNKLREELHLVTRTVIAVQKKYEEEHREHLATLSLNSDLRRDLEHTQTLYREATEVIMGLRQRIRFLDDIAHKTGHIIKLDSGGTL